MKYLLISLYDGVSTELSFSEFKDWIRSSKPKRGAIRVWMFEEHMVVEMPGAQ